MCSCCWYFLTAKNDDSFIASNVNEFVNCLIRKSGHVTHLYSIVSFTLHPAADTNISLRCSLSSVFRLQSDYICYHTMQIMDDNLIEEKRKKDMSKKLNMKNTRYLASQAEELIRVFESNPYPENDMCESLALKLNLQQHQVYKWFKNRRWRERKR